MWLSDRLKGMEWWFRYNSSRHRNNSHNTFPVLSPRAAAGKFQKVGSGTLISNGQSSSILIPRIMARTTVSSGTLLVDNHATGSGLMR